LKKYTLLNPETAQPSFNKEHKSQAVGKRQIMGVGNKAKPCLHIDGGKLILWQIIPEDGGVGFRW